jgi:phage terminase large subunit-like protein
LASFDFQVASAKFEAGQALLPERASWLPDLEAELFSFPGSRHDDQCVRSAKRS